MKTENKNETKGKSGIGANIAGVIIFVIIVVTAGKFVIRVTKNLLGANTPKTASTETVSSDSDQSIYDDDYVPQSMDEVDARVQKRLDDVDKKLQDSINKSCEKLDSTDLSTYGSSSSSNTNKDDGTTTHYRSIDYGEIVPAIQPYTDDLTLGKKMEQIDPQHSGVQIFVAGESKDCCYEITDKDGNKVTMDLYYAPQTDLPATYEFTINGKDVDEIEMLQYLYPDKKVTYESLMRFLGNQDENAGWECDVSKLG